jgi:clorobiocin biosynthesis protein CloN6
METVDWSFYKPQKIDLTASKLIMTLPNTGCAYDCPWCGGSRFAYKKIMGVKETLITKDHDRIVDELKTLSDSAHITSIYALQCYSESKTRLNQYLDAVKEVGYKKVFFEQYHLTDQKTLKRMGKSTQSYIMLSPESHDSNISKLAGRGTYTMAEMEEWIQKALDVGIAGIYVWFFIGMPRQTTQSVLDTVSYCESLLRKFRSKNVLPLICPMVPFLDPGSRFFEEPEKHGYKIYYRTLEQHRQAMLEPLWYKRLNYETKWMSRREIQDITYEAITRLVNIKSELGLLPQSLGKAILSTIDQTKLLLREIERSLSRDGKLTRGLRDEIRLYNRKMLAYSSDQIIPVRRPIGGRWFDDFAVPKDLISTCMKG